MRFVREGKADTPFPASVEGAAAEEARQAIYGCCRPVGPGHLAETLARVSGYYLVGGNTYTMSLFHHMWDHHASASGGVGHMQLLTLTLTLTLTVTLTLTLTPTLTLTLTLTLTRRAAARSSWPSTACWAPRRPSCRR